VSTRLVVIGDALLDRDLSGTVDRVCPDAPVPVVDEVVERLRPGGAALAACLAAAAGDDVEVVLVTSLGHDLAAGTVLELLGSAGVEVEVLRRRGATLEKTRVRAGGQSLLRFDRGRRSDDIEPAEHRVVEMVAGADAVLVADYGAGVATVAELRQAMTSARRPRRPLVWDPHPRGADAVSGAWLITPNEPEVEALDVLVAAGIGARGSQRSGRLAHAAARGRRLAQRWQARSVAVTLGADGALLVEGDQAPLVVPADPITGDACGAGDCFAGAAAIALARGAVPSEAVTEAVAAAGRFITAGGAAGWSSSRTPARQPPTPPHAQPARQPAPPAHSALRPPSLRQESPLSQLHATVLGAGARLAMPGAVGLDDALSVVRGSRKVGGTVVATGGCFDLLHAGHVAVLSQARRLGDCLVVCLNSDASVRRLKGPGRPLQSAEDRAAVLASLACVDAVVTFDEDTPAEVLDRLRPDLFAKGGDYALGTLPEEEVLAAWGAQVVLLPYLPGRSTSALVEEAGRQAGC